MGFNKGVFGGSAARARWRLQRVMMSFWLIIAAWGWALHAWVGTPIWLTLFLYTMGLLVFHGWHVAAHQRWLCPPMYRVHMFHHWQVYPPSRFLTRTYINDKAGRTRLGSLLHDGPLYVGMLGSVASLYALDVLDVPGVVASVLTYAFVGDFANWLHHTFHIEGHFIERFVYFHDLRALHYTHHQGTARHNFGFLDFAGDAAAGTMREADYALSNSAAAADAAKKKLGRGDEHRSSLRPGEPPTLLRDGPRECLHCGVCFIIEGIVGLQGTVLGKAHEEAAQPRGAGAGKHPLPEVATPSAWDFFMGLK